MSGTNNGIDGIVAAQSRLDSFELCHLRQENGGSSSYNGGPALPAIGHALSGGVASALSTALVYPIDTIVTRMQVQKGLKGERETTHAAEDADAEYKDVLDAARKIYHNEGGLKAFYAGLSSDVVKHIADSFLFFFAYGAVRERMLRRQGGKDMSVLNELTVGVLAGAMSKAVTTPIQQVVTRQQTSAITTARDPGSSPRAKSFTAILSQIRDEKGVAGLWAGYPAQLVLTLNPAITFAVDNLLRRLQPKRYRDVPTPASTFLIAALSKVIATTITYPVMLAKSRQQAYTGSASDLDESTYQKVEQKAEEKVRPSSEASRSRLRQGVRQLTKLVDGQIVLFHALQKIYQHEGIAGLYSGLQGEWVKGFLQHGLTMTVKESVHIGIIQLYYILLKLTKKWPAEIKESAGAAVHEAKERAENVGVSLVEGAKDLQHRVSGQDVSSTAQDARQRAENVAVTVAEGAKDLSKKATGQDD